MAIQPPAFDNRKGSWATTGKTDFQAEQTLKVAEQTLKMAGQTIKVVDQTLKSLKDEAEKTNKAVNEVIANPTQFFAHAAKGIVQGLFGPSTDSSVNNDHTNAPASVPIIGNLPNSDSASGIKSLLANFLESLKSSIVSGVTTATASASQALLEKIISMANVYDLDDEDTSILNECSIILKDPDAFVKREVEKYKQENFNNEPPENHDLNKQKPLQYAVNHVWKRLDKYHVIVAGVNVNNFNFFNSSDLNEKSGKNNGTSPISLISIFKTKLANLCSDWQLSEIPEVTEVLPSPVILKDLSDIIEEDALKPITQEISHGKPPVQQSDIANETEAVMTKFASKTIQFSTMLCVEYIFGKTPENNQEQEIAKKDFRRIMSNNSNPDDVRRAFASRYKGISYYLIQIPYLIVYKLIAPIINDTSTALIKDIKKVLNNEIDVIKVTKQKLDEMSIYFGSIETARKQYLIPSMHQTGTLDAYLTQQVRKYGNKFTEKELFEHLENYLVKNYVKRPDFSIRGVRLPLLTTIVEGIIWGVQKKMLLSYLRRSQTLKTLLEQGTNSVKYAQLGVKTFLRDKLKEIVVLIEKSQAKASSHDYTEITDTSNPTTQKTSLITAELEETVRTFSNKALRFIDIEACRNDDKELSALNNEVIDVANSIFKSFNINLFSTQKPLEDAASNMILMSLKALTDSKDNRGEEQLRTVIQTLMKNYDAPSNSDEEEQKIQLDNIEKTNAIDTELGQLINRLSELAVDNALAEKVRNFTENKHASVTKFVDETKESVQNLSNVLNTSADHISEIQNEERENNGLSRFEKTKNHLSLITSTITRFINKVTSNISPAQKKCYRDVAGDYFNLIHTIVGENGLTKLQEKLNTIAENNERIKLIEDIEVQLEFFKEKINSISVEKRSDILTQIKEETIRDLPKIFNEYLFIKSFKTSISNKISEYFDVIIKEKKENENRTERNELLSQLESAIPLMEKNLKLFTQLQNSLQEYLEIQESITELKHHKKDKSIDIKTINDKITKLKDLIGIDHANSALKNIYSLFNGNYPFTEQQLLSFAKNKHYQVECKKNLDSIINETKKQFNQINIIRKSLKTNVNNFNNDKTEEDKTISGFLKNFKDDMTKIKNLLHFKNDTREENKFLETIGDIKKQLNESIIQSNTSIENNRNLLIEKKLEISENKDLTKRTAKDAISQNCKNLNNIVKEITDLLDHFKVKGFISIGQTHIQQFLEPPIRDKLNEVIGTKITTLVKALGKPYHYKQLALELILLPVASEETEGKT